MINKEKTITNYIGRGIFILFFFLFIGAFSSTGHARSHDRQEQFKQDQSFGVKELIATNTPSISFTGLDFSSNNYFIPVHEKQDAGLKAKTQRFFSFQQCRLQFPITSSFGFYYYFFKPADEVPVS